MDLIHTMHEQLYNEVCRGTLGANHYSNSSRKYMKACLEHFPFLECKTIGNALVSTEWTYRFGYSHCNQPDRIDLQTLVSRSRKDLQLLLFPVYQRLSDISAVDSPISTCLYDIRMTINQTRRQIYDDVCKGMFRGPYNLGTDIHANLVSKDFPKKDIEITSSKRVDHYTYVPSKSKTTEIEPIANAKV